MLTSNDLRWPPMTKGIQAELEYDKIHPPLGISFTTTNLSKLNWDYRPMTSNGLSQPKTTWDRNFFNRACYALRSFDLWCQTLNLSFQWIDLKPQDWEWRLLPPESQSQNLKSCSNTQKLTETNIKKKKTHENTHTQWQAYTHKQTDTTEQTHTTFILVCVWTKSNYKFYNVDIFLLT